MKLLRVVVGVVLLACGSWSLSADAQVSERVSATLNLAPADAQMLVIVPDPARLSDRVAAMREELGLPYPDLDDALGAFKRKSGMLDGVDDTGVLLLIINGLERIEAADASPQVMVLMPVSDYTAFVGQFGGDAAADVAELKLDSGESGFARSVEGYAVFTGQRGAVADYAPGQGAETLLAKVGALGVDALADADAATLIDLTQTTDANPQLVEAGLRLAGETLEGLMRSPTPPADDRQPPRGSPVRPATGDNSGSAGTALRQFGSLFTNLAGNDMLRDGLNAMMNDSQAMVLAGELGRGDTAVTLAFQLKEDAQASAIFKSSSDRTGDLLIALPDRPYLLAAASDGEALDLSALLAKVTGDGGDAGPILRLKAQALPLADQVNAAAAAIYTPSDNAIYSGSLLNAVALYRVEDGPKFIEALTAYFHGLNQLEAGPDGTTYQADYIANALRLADDVRVDQFKLNPVIPRATLDAMSLPTQALITSMFPMNGYAAAKGNDVVLVTSLDTQQITRALEALDQKAGLGSAADIAGRHDRTLPPGTVMEVYADVAGVAELADLVLPTLGLPGPPPAGDLPPLSLGVGVEGRSVAFRLDLPDDSMRYLIESVTLLREQLRPAGSTTGGDPFTY